VAKLASKYETIRIAETLSTVSDAQRDSFLDQFSRHVERGAALGAVARLDDALKRAIQARMIDDADLKDNMFHETGPIGSLGVRIRFGYMMGVYTKTSYKELKAINNIRNAFAHSEDAYDFKHKKVSGLCSSMAIIKWLRRNISKTDNAANENLPSLVKLAMKRGFDLTEYNYGFIFTCLLFMVRLRAEANDPPPLPRPPRF
jgi:DNA-binding MltR family transcriptional regulator